jgi:hypothetical protein
MPDITFGYSDSEDRIWISLGSRGRYWLTRRMALGFLPKAAELLEMTVAGGDIPNALPASQRVALEFEAALQDGLDGKPAMAVNKETRTEPLGADRPPPPPSLLTTLSVSARGEAITLVLEPDRPEASITMQRVEFHRLLGALLRSARNAGWDLRGLPEWMTRLPF